MELSALTKAFHASLSELYEAPMHITLSEPEPKPEEFNMDLFARLQKYLHTAGRFAASMLQDEEPLTVIQQTAKILQHGVDAGMAAAALQEQIDEEFVEELKKNVWYFSAAKTFQQCIEMSAQLTDAFGNLKPFAEFEADTMPIGADYNQNWLKAEWQLAVGSGYMAEKWHEFEEDGDDYLLQYRTAGDAYVRPEHAVLNGITLPPSDKFWDNYYPPLGWNCRCDVSQVRREDHKTSDSAKAVALGEAATSKPKEQIFRFNCGKQRMVFPAKHPYYKMQAEDKQTIINFPVDYGQED